MNTHQISTRVHNGKIIVDAPPDLKNNQEVLLTIEYTPDKKKFDFATLSGGTKLGLSIEEIDEELRKLKDEWDRDIL